MTDNEIIKALECCSTDVRENTCPKCAFYKKHRCSTLMLNAASDLINRQKAEIERLQKNIDGLNIFIKNHIKVIRLQAIKEFAERLKCGVPQETGVIRCADVDNLVKEMTEKNNDFKAGGRK